MAQAIEAIRNLALVGQAGAGKTRLAEALLAAAERTPQAAAAARGGERDALEEVFGHSVDSAVMHFFHAGVLVNLLDTPGYSDLLGRCLAVLPAVETVAVVINAEQGIEMGARRLMEAARRRRLDRLLIINRIDAARRPLARLVEELRDSFGPECLPINLPLDQGRRVVDCFFTRSGPDTELGPVADAHRRIIEQVVEVDEALLEPYLAGEENLSGAQLHDAFERALREDHLVPICFTSPATGAGIAEVLELIVRLLPNPTEGHPPAFVKSDGAGTLPVTVSPDPSAHVLAHVFKLTADPYLGRIAAFRVHQGTVRAGRQLLVGDARKPVKIAHLYKPQGRQLVEVDAVAAGDIGAAVKLEDLHYDAVLHDAHEEDHHHLEAGSLPPPMVGIAIAPARSGDEQKLGETLQKLLAEDPSLRVEHLPALNETVLYGHGPLHHRVVLERMKRHFGVEAQAHAPGIPYRETISRAAEGHHRHKKQTGGAGQFGEVYLRVEPLPPGTGFQFVDAVTGGAIPSAFIPAVEKGVRQVLQSGVVAGYPMQDVRVIVHDGKSHPVDGKEVAFLTAGRKAFQAAVAAAAPVVLEPIVNLTVTTPAQVLGAVIGELTALRGRIASQSVLPDGLAAIEAQAPLSELHDYHQRLHAQTSGEGVYQLEFSHYEPVPPRLQQELLALHAQRRRGEADAS